MKKFLYFLQLSGAFIALGSSSSEASIDDIKDNLSRGVHGIASIPRVVGKGVHGLATNILPDTLNLGKNLASSLSDFGSDIASAGKNFSEGKISDTISSIGSGLGGLSKNVVQNIGDFSSNVLNRIGMDNVSKMTKQLTDSLGEGSQKLIETAGKSGVNSWDALRKFIHLHPIEAAKALKKTGVEALAGVGDSIQTVGVGTRKFLSDSFGALDKNVGDAASTIIGKTAGGYVTKGMDLLGKSMATSMIGDSIEQIGGTFTDLSKGKILHCTPGTVTCKNPENPAVSKMPKTFPFDQHLVRLKGCQPVEKSMYQAMAKCAAFGGVDTIDQSRFNASGALANALLASSNFFGMGGLSAEQEIAEQALKKIQSRAAQTIAQKAKHAISSGASAAWNASIGKAIAGGMTIGMLMQQDNKTDQEKQEEFEEENKEKEAEEAEKAKKQ